MNFLVHLLYTLILQMNKLGKKGLIGLFMGEVMKLSKGKEVLDVRKRPHI